MTNLRALESRKSDRIVLRNASRCGGFELLRVAHRHCSAKNTPSATAGSQKAREKQGQGTATQPQALNSRSTPGRPAVEISVR
jgi:hypothetical protein